MISRIVDQRLLVALLLCLLVPAISMADNAALLARIKAVGKQGQGIAEAARAWKELVEQGPAALFDVLGALDEDNVVSSNWLRPAIDAIADRVAEGKGLPQDKLESFIKDTGNPPLGRRVAYELLTSIDKTAPGRLLPGMLKDASSDLRRDAVALVIKEAEALLKKDDKDGAKKTLRKAFDAACDDDQVKTIADHLTKLGEKVDLARHFGFVLGWRLVAPFDNANAAHFQKVHPPEQGVELKDSYQSKDGKDVRWQGYTTADPHGEVDLNRLFGDWKGVTAYAFAVVESPQERRVQVRAGSPNAVKIFVNGKEVITHDEYHHGARIDQYTGMANLKAGRNEVLVKVCQNEKKESWEKDWKFQLRLCDKVGSAVPFTQTPVKSELTLRELPKEKK